MRLCLLLCWCAKGLFRPLCHHTSLPAPLSIRPPRGFLDLAPPCGTGASFTIICDYIFASYLYGASTWGGSGSISPPQGLFLPPHAAILASYLPIWVLPGDLGFYRASSLYVLYCSSCTLSSTLFVLFLYFPLSFIFCTLSGRVSGGLAQGGLAPGGGYVLCLFSFLLHPLSSSCCLYSFR